MNPNVAVAGRDGTVKYFSATTENDEIKEIPMWDGRTWTLKPLPETAFVTPPTPSQLREEAYNTQAIISFGGEMLTVTESSQKWQYYAAEGNTEKTDELTALIAEAKASIREQYPDEEGGA